MTNYATFQSPLPPPTVPVRGRSVELGTWISLWVSIGLLAAPLLAALVLFLMCHGVHQ
jgi:hypothetical protein